MRKVSIQVNSNIHLAANLSILIVIEAGVGVGITYIVNSWWVWSVVFFMSFWIIAFLGHRVFPRLTGPLVDGMFPMYNAEHEDEKSN